MSPPAKAPGSDAAARPKWSRWRKVFAVIGALILVFVGGYVVYGYLNGLPPQVVASGGTGHVYLDAALMTFYEPSIPGATDYNVSVTVLFAAGEHFPFAWGNVSGTSLPVRFVLAPSAAFRVGPADGFEYGEGGTGPESLGTDRVTPPGAYVSTWSLTYSVRELSAWDGFTQTTWLQVDYALSVVSLDFGGYLPIANVTVPGASDLAPTGVVDNLNLSAEPGYLWTIDRNLTDFAIPASPFHHTLPAVTFEAGSAGTFSAALTSSFTWGKGDEYRVTASGSGTTHGALTWYWDERFGALYSMYAP